jgi:hydroxyacylglutathione hydrolase
MGRYAARVFPVGLFQCNCTVFWDLQTRCAVVVDPGDEFEKILEVIDGEKLKVSMLWHTHAHLDHLGATKILWDLLSQRSSEAGIPAPSVKLHSGDRWLYENIATQSAMLRLPTFEVPTEFSPIQDGEKYPDFEGLAALHTPGHTPGSCCLSVKKFGDDLEAPNSFFQASSDAGASLLISGDTLFRRSIGRTDLWGGDSERILKSIRNRLWSLPEETLVIPGHGPFTSIGEERSKNPFLK